MLLGNADLILPDVEGLLVSLVDGGPQEIFGDLHDLGQKFPREFDGFFLEIIAEGKVAEHFKIGTVASGLPHALQVGSSDTLLTGGHAAAGRFFFSGEILLHGSHAGVDEEKRFVVDGNQRITGQTEMSLAFKIREELLANFIQTPAVHCIVLPFKR